jgi:hypothetical protein
MVRCDDVAARVYLYFPRQAALLSGGVVILVAAYVLIPSSDVQLAQGIADLHIQIEVGTQKGTWRGPRLVDQATSSRSYTRDVLHSNWLDGKGVGGWPVVHSSLPGMIGESTNI